MGPWECAVSKALEQQRRSARKIPEMYIFKFNHYGISGVTNLMLQIMYQMMQ
jgi:hypothetical protein